MEQDFDRGLGIGGLARHEETPEVPSAENIVHAERKSRQARRCRKCGQTDVWDGAMFTTGSGGDICDDCY